MMWGNHAGMTQENNFSTRNKCKSPSHCCIHWGTCLEVFEQLLMAYNKLPDVCQVVHAVTLLHQNLLCVSANTGVSSKQHDADETSFALLHGMDNQAHAASVTSNKLAAISSNKSQE